MRRNGQIVTVPLAYEVRRIDFGDGEKEAMTIPWGDVATAYTTTGIPNIQVFMPAPPKLIASARRANLIRPLLGLAWVQRLIKARIAKTVKGPMKSSTPACPPLCGVRPPTLEATAKTARIRTANGYSLTIAGSLAVVEYLMSHGPEGGAYTPAKLVGVDLVTGLPGSGGMEVR